MRITLNAFSFLRKTIAQNGFGYLNTPMNIAEDATIADLIAVLKLEPQTVEAAFVNHKVVPKETKLHEGDRVALVPPGTPGSYRLIMGLKERAGT
jgi:sulfur carrier protein ThiS